MSEKVFTISIDEFIEIAEQIKKSKLGRIQEVRISIDESHSGHALHYTIDILDKRSRFVHQLYKKIINQEPLEIENI